MKCLLGAQVGFGTPRSCSHHLCSPRAAPGFQEAALFQVTRAAHLVKDCSSGKRGDESKGPPPRILLKRSITT